MRTKAILGPCAKLITTLVVHHSDSYRALAIYKSHLVEEARGEITVIKSDSLQRRDETDTVRRPNTLLKDISFIRNLSSHQFSFEKADASVKLALFRI